MSRVELSALKGLTVHKTGQGFIDTNLQEITITANAGNAAAEKLLSSTAEKAALMHLVISNNSSDPTNGGANNAAQTDAARASNVLLLPNSATKGQIKVVILQASVAGAAPVDSADKRQGKLEIKNSDASGVASGAAIATLTTNVNDANSAVNAVQDFAVCVYDGSAWVAGVSKL